MKNWIIKKSGGFTKEDFDRLKAILKNKRYKIEDARNKKFTC